ncbi:MAG: copper amine oxidase N-terminal domain-containing protein [Armatimonadota bacterium]
MKSLSRIMLWVAVLTAVSTAAWSADQLVSLYVGGKKVNCQPEARVHNGVTYAPLRASSQAVGAHVEWNGQAQTATVCLSDRCVPIRAKQGLMVDGALLLAVRLMSEALGRPVSWDAKANVVRIK